MCELVTNNSLENHFRELGPNIAAEYSWDEAAKNIEKIISKI